MRGNPMGILMVGVGVVLLQLAYSGRGVAVWNALRGADGAAAAPATGTGTPPAGGPPIVPNAPATGMAGDAGGCGCGCSGDCDGNHMWGIVEEGGIVRWGVRGA